MQSAGPRSEAWPVRQRLTDALDPVASRSALYSTDPSSTGAIVLHQIHSKGSGQECMTNVRMSSCQSSLNSRASRAADDSLVLLFWNMLCKDYMACETLQQRRQHRGKQHD